MANAEAQAECIEGCLFPGRHTGGCRVLLAEAQAEVDAMEHYTGMVCRNCGGPAHIGSCRPKGKTSKAEARAELEALRVELAEEARLDNYITVLVQRNVKTGSDVIQVLEGLKAMGVTYDSLAHYADTVWPNH